MTNFPHFYVTKSMIKKFFLAHQEKFGKYDLKNSFGKYYISSSFDYSNWATIEPTGAAPQSIKMYGRAGLEPGKWTNEAPTTRIVGFVCSYYL